MTKVLEQELEEVREVRGGNIFNLEHNDNSCC